MARKKACEHDPDYEDGKIIISTNPKRRLINIEINGMSECAIEIAGAKKLIQILNEQVQALESSKEILN